MDADWSRGLQRRQIVSTAALRAIAKADSGAKVTPMQVNEPRYS
jgi:hypothetical protein